MMTQQKNRTFKKAFWVALGFILGIVQGAIVHSEAEDFKPAVAKEPKEGPYDTLDGAGNSRVNLYFVDWWSQSKQYHLRVKTKNRVIGFNAEIDKDKEKKEKDPVLVLEYKVQGIPYTIVRRYTLSSRGLEPGFKIYEDTTSDDEELFMFTNNTLTDNVREIKYGKPRQKYPDHYGQDGTAAAAKTKSYDNTVPTQENLRFQKVDHDTRVPAKTPAAIDEIDEDGGIRPYEF